MDLKKISAIETFIKDIKLNKISKEVVIGAPKFIKTMILAKFNINEFTSLRSSILLDDVIFLLTPKTQPHWLTAPTLSELIDTETFFEEFAIVEKLKKVSSEKLTDLRIDKLTYFKENKDGEEITFHGLTKSLKEFFTNEDVINTVREYTRDSEIVFEMEAIAGLFETVGMPEDVLALPYSIDDILYSIKEGNILYIKVEAVDALLEDSIRLISEGESITECSTMVALQRLKTFATNKLMQRVYEFALRLIEK